MEYTGEREHGGEHSTPGMIPAPPQEQLSRSMGPRVTGNIRGQRNAIQHGLGPRLVARMMKWLTVSLLVGLSPIIINVFMLYSDGKEVSRLALFGTGELYLVSMGIIAAGIGELYFELKDGEGSDGPYTQISISIAVLLSVVLAIYCAGAYGGRPASPNPLDRYPCPFTCSPVPSSRARHAHSCRNSGREGEMEPGEIAVLTLTSFSLLNVVIAAVYSWQRRRRSRSDVALTIRSADGQEIRVTHDQLRRADQLRDFMSRCEKNGEGVTKRSP